MNVTRIFLDDLTIYNATAEEYGEEGEIVDVYAPAMPTHLVQSVGQLVQVKLGYVYCEELRSGWMRFESVAEALECDAVVIMRFVNQN